MAIKSVAIVTVQPRHDGRRKSGSPRFSPSCWLQEIRTS